MRYDDSCEKSVIAHAQELVGKTIEEIISEFPFEVNKKNKGLVGHIIEECWFDMPKNSSPLPDFSKIGVELKVIPLKLQKNKLTVKERTKVCSIDYMKLIDENWKSSHAKIKLNKILFIYYVYNKEDIKQSKIKKIDLWQLKDNHNELIIENDWQTVKQKVVDGYAHTLSARDSKILAASTSGQGKNPLTGEPRDLVKQPNIIHQDSAMKRAFSLKQSFTNQHWLEISTKTKYESIIDSLNIKDFSNFEKDFLDRLHAIKNESISSLSLEYNIKIGNGKNRVATVMKKVIGFKNVQSKIKEFEQLGIIVKMINVRKKDNFPCEAISFPAMKLNEFSNETWEESTFKNLLSRILFIPIYKDHCNSQSLDNHILGKSFFWSPNEEEENLIKEEWDMYQNEVLTGKCKVTRIPNNTVRGYKEVTELSKESVTKIIHMRPHGRNADDRDEDLLGNDLVKQSFWLNKKFVQSLLNKNN